MLTIISGGQTGVDQAALAVAYDLGFRTGGTAPLGYRTDAGPMPTLLRDRYGLEESPFPSYRIRTMDNVRAADLTVWFGHDPSPGYRLTIGTCQRLNKVHLINPEWELLARRLVELRIQILNCAGHRKRTHPEAADQATLILGSALAAIRG